MVDARLSSFRDPLRARSITRRDTAPEMSRACGECRIPGLEKNGTLC